MIYLQLFIIGLIAAVILIPLVEWICDNHSDIDLIEEQKLTDMYKDRL